MEYISESNQTGAEILWNLEVYDDTWSVNACSSLDYGSVFCTIFSGTADRLTQIYRFVELYKYVEVYGV